MIIKIYDHRFVAKYVVDWGYNEKAGALEVTTTKSKTSIPGPKTLLGQFDKRYYDLIDVVGG